MKTLVLMSILLLAPACSRAKSQKKAVTSAVVTEKHGQKTVDVEFIGKKGVFRIHAEVADTFAIRERGLMFRRHLDADKGMVFVFPHEVVNTFWMKNTLIPLDMVFVDRKLRVIGVVHHAKPLDETPVGVEAPSMYVVELPAGTAKARGIEIGTRLVFHPSVPKARE